MTTTKIYIENLKCHGCASTIRRETGKFPEVKEVEVSLDESSVSVSHNGDEDFREKLTKRLTKLGYPEVGTNSTLNKAKSFVSCAIGRMN